MATEHAPKGRAGLYGAAPQMGVPPGVFLANAVFLLCTSLMSEQAFLSWGWRVPFLLSFTLVAVAMCIQPGVMESPAFEAVEQEERTTRVPIVEVLTQSWRTVLLAGGTLVATNGIAYVFMVYVLAYGTQELGFSRGTMLALLLAACPLWMAGMGISAHLQTASDGAASTSPRRSPCSWCRPASSRCSTRVRCRSCWAPCWHWRSSSAARSVRSQRCSPSCSRCACATAGRPLATKSAILGGGLAPFVATWLDAEFGTTTAISAYFVALSTQPGLHAGAAAPAARGRAVHGAVADRGADRHPRGRDGGPLT